MNDVTGNQENNHVADDAGTAVGQRLRAARNRHKLGVDRVANELHLDASIINAIENEDRAALPAQIFVQGYIRSYARLLGLPEDELVRQYVAQGDEPPPLSVIGSGEKMPLLRLPSHRLIRNVILIMLAVILLWLAWPMVERVLESRTTATEAPEPGRLELPTR